MKTLLLILISFYSFGQNTHIMKYILITLLLLSCLFSQAQSKRLVEISKEYFTQDIPVTDGLIYKYKIPSDTARYFAPGPDVYDVVVTFKRRGVVVPPTDIVEDVDDRDSRIVYGTGWDKTCCTSDPNSPHFNSTISFHCTVGGTFTFTFVGKSVTWFAEKLKTHGIVGVKFDSETSEAPIDLYSPTQLTRQAVFTKTWPTVGEHKVIIRITGKNPLAVANCLVSDYFRIIK